MNLQITAGFFIDYARMCNISLQMILKKLDNVTSWSIIIGKEVHADGIQ
jgi:hypothetical protein